MAKRTPKILIVDDEQDFLDTIIDALKSVKKYKLYTANNSKNTFEILKEEKIDILIIDYLLKGDIYNGDKVIRVIRDQEKSDSYKHFLHCILMTGSEGKRQFLPEITDLRINFYDKSAGPPELIRKIEECMREKGGADKSNPSKAFWQHFVYPLWVRIIGTIIAGTILIFIGMFITKGCGDNSNKNGKSTGGTEQSSSSRDGTSK